MQRANPETRRLLGGAACLDFANSVDWASDGTERPRHTDVLTTPQHLATWGQRLGLVPPGTALPVTGHELKAAWALRRAIHSTFAAIAARSAPQPAELDLLARHYQQAVTASHLSEHDGCWQLDWQPDDIRRVRFAAAASAVDLLGDRTRLSRVRMCPGGNCGWLFLDTSGRRQWCSMDVCGSRAKMRRLYQRQHQTGGGTAGRARTLLELGQRCSWCSGRRLPINVRLMAMATQPSLPNR